MSEQTTTTHSETRAAGSSIGVHAPEPARDVFQTDATEAADNSNEPTFTISELSRAFDVTPRALRFYESKGLLNPRRKGMSRLYSRRDRGRLSLILRGKRVGFSLIEIKDMLDLYDLRGGQDLQLRTAFGKFGERIAALEEQRNAIDSAISELEDARAEIKSMIDGLEQS